MRNEYHTWVWRREDPCSLCGPWKMLPHHAEMMDARRKEHLAHWMLPTLARL